MRHSTVKLALVALFVATIPISAPAATIPAPEISVASDRLAAGGYDVTAYFLHGKPLRGSEDHQFQYKGAIWRFASAESLSQFQANPAAFEPKFGGYCAWAVSQGYIASGDPQQWKIVDGKLYLNYNAQAKALWEADQQPAIARANANWPTVLTKNQNS